MFLNLKKIITLHKTSYNKKHFYAILNEQYLIYSNNTEIVLKMKLSVEYMKLDLEESTLKNLNLLQKNHIKIDNNIIPVF